MTYDQSRQLYWKSSLLAAEVSRLLRQDSQGIGQYSRDSLRLRVNDVWDVLKEIEKGEGK